MILLTNAILQGLGENGLNKQQWLHQLRRSTSFSSFSSPSGRLNSFGLDRRSSFSARSSRRCLSSGASDPKLSLAKAVSLVKWMKTPKKDTSSAAKVEIPPHHQPLPACAPPSDRHFTVEVESSDVDAPTPSRPARESSFSLARSVFKAPPEAAFASQAEHLTTAPASRNKVAAEPLAEADVVPGVVPALARVRSLQRQKVGSELPRQLRWLTAEVRNSEHAAEPEDSDFAI